MTSITDFDTVKVSGDIADIDASSRETLKGKIPAKFAQMHGHNIITD